MKPRSPQQYPVLNYFPRHNAFFHKSTIRQRSNNAYPGESSNGFFAIYTYSRSSAKLIISNAKIYLRSVELLRQMFCANLDDISESNLRESRGGAGVLQGGCTPGWKKDVGKISTGINFSSFNTC